MVVVELRFDIVGQDRAWLGCLTTSFRRFVRGCRALAVSGIDSGKRVGL